MDHSTTWCFPRLAAPAPPLEQDKEKQHADAGRNGPPWSISSACPITWSHSTDGAALRQDRSSLWKGKEMEVLAQKVGLFFLRKLAWISSARLENKVVFLLRGHQLLNSPQCLKEEGLDPFSTHSPQTCGSLPKPQSTCQPRRHPKK